MTIAVAGCVAQAEGEEIIRRAPAVDLVVGPQTYHQLPDYRARARADGRARGRDRFPRRGKVRRACRRRAARPRRRHRLSHRSRKAATSSAPSASCPTRAAPNFRGPAAQHRGRGAHACRARACARSPARPERECLSRRTQRADRFRWQASSARLSRIDGIDRLRYMTSHPRDMDDDLIALHGEKPKADAVSASAGAVGLRSHPQGHEPQARRARTICDLIAAGARRRGPTSRSRAISSSASPARARRISRRRSQLVREVELRRVPSRSNIRRAPARPPPSMTSRCPRR